MTFGPSLHNFLSSTSPETQFALSVARGPSVRLRRFMQRVAMHLIVVKVIQANFYLNYSARMPLITIKCIQYMHLIVVKGILAKVGPNAFDNN